MKYEGAWSQGWQLLSIFLVALSLTFVNIAPSTAVSHVLLPSGHVASNSYTDFTSAAMGQCSIRPPTGITTVQSQLEEVDYISIAQSEGYVTQGGQIQDFSRATVTQLDGVTVVAVPTSSPHKDLEPVNHVSYVFTGELLTDTLELKSSYTAGYLGASYTMWVNGEHVVSDQVTYWQYVLGQVNDKHGNGYSPTGLSWNDFRRCISEQGISWVAITIAASVCGLACTFVPFSCAYCTAGALGTNVGVVLSCVQWAWK
ncbi:hypothetical protein J2S70_001137 [Trueperella bonasi]|uniref:Uncharacterized protein n=1 Tax=Trueperella bonasi TaxID=312286 RepID=A0ABT9NGL5_9ACTO|nr:hypothetical protein [Trueperella bonasi]MDP9806555.1 hypothetical protein [Trueperella bonasi]